MKVAIDTSSLLSMVRYYHLFDSNQKLYDLIKTKIQAKDIILLHSILQESKLVANGLILNKLFYLADNVFTKQHITKDNLITDAKISNKIDEFYTKQFKDKISRSEINAQEIELLQQSFYETADCKLMSYAAHYNSLNHDCINIITEEQPKANDKKDFEKIPVICYKLGIQTFTLPEYIQKLQENAEITFQIT